MVLCLDRDTAPVVAVVMAADKAEGVVAMVMVVVEGVDEVVEEVDEAVEEVEEVGGTV